MRMCDASFLFAKDFEPKCHVTPRFWIQGKSLAKECIGDFVWALKPLAVASPNMPIHNDSLFQTLRMTVSQSEPDGKIWLMVYDLKVLMQYLSYSREKGIMFEWVFIIHYTCRPESFRISGLLGRHGGRPVKLLRRTRVGRFGSNQSPMSWSSSRSWRHLQMMTLAKHGALSLN